VTGPVWLEKASINDIHAEQLALFGGPPGVRDEGLLESALSRPINKWGYGEQDLAALAAAYAYGLVKNHPFIDGNTRIAFLAMMIFLRLNGVPFRPPQAEAAAIVLEVAAGSVGEGNLARWIRDRMP
jgi:death-on-curing protein